MKDQNLDDLNLDGVDFSNLKLVENLNEESFIKKCEL